MYAGGAYAPTWYRRRITGQVHVFTTEFGIGPARQGAARRAVVLQRPAGPAPAGPARLTPL